ncbi:MAG: lamin tail domain-containing protein [Gemmatimonadales bacterium]
MMTMRYVAFFFAVMVVLSSLAPTGAAQIRLNEIMADPDSDWDGDSVTGSKEDEWVEVTNIGGSTVDLSAYRLTDLSAGTEFRFALSGALAPGEAAVFYGSAVVAWQQANGVSAFGLSLNNSGDTVFLYEVNGTDTTVVDSYAYATNEVRDNRSVGRMPEGTGNWVIFDALNPYTGSDYVATGCTPSPGAGTDCATPTKEMSWGRVKSEYVIQ